MLKNKKTLALYVLIIILLIVVGVITAHNITKNENLQKGAVSISGTFLSYTCRKQANQLGYFGSDSAFQQLHNALDDSLVDGGVTDDYSDPIDKYYIPEMNDTDKCYAEIRGAQMCYYFVWKEEYENIITCIKEECETEVDIEKVKKLDKHIQSCLDELSYTQQFENDKGIGATAKSLYITGKLYREYSLRLIASYYSNSSYAYMDKDYSKIIIP